MKGLLLVLTLCQTTRFVFSACVKIGLDCDPTTDPLCAPKIAEGDETIP